ncbi:MAG: TetR/AcrR family transcriptional regulator [Lachnospiraceae bacterium]|nr:TetR/AcrR family transcriptional regulator [Lachnospiraceae bacterium]
MEKQRITGGAIVQNRAVKTREKILETALRVYAGRGYYNTTMDEIAKAAEVSVGTAYRYFSDKKQLLLAALEYGFTHVSEFAGVSETDLIGDDLDRALAIFEKIHEEYYDLHEELEGLRHTDSDVRKLYHVFTEAALQRIHEKLSEEIRRRPNSLLNLRIAIGLMENHCHYCMHETPDEQTAAYMRKRTVELAGIIIFGTKEEISGKEGCEG